MAPTKTKQIVVLTLLLLVIVGALVFGIGASDPLGGKVRQILVRDMMPSSGKWDQGMNKLWALGPDVIPRLAVESSRRDTLLSKKYAAMWKKLPPRLRPYLPAPIDHADLRHAAMQAIAEFGPLAARRAAPQVIAALKEKDFWRQNYSTRCLLWLLPESQSALAAFQQGLAGADTNWPTPDHFLDVGDDSVWPKIPEVAPLLTNFLRDSGHAYQAAIALGRLGSNAALAIPALVQTVDMGAAGFTNAKAARNHVGEAFSNPQGVHLATMISDNKSMNHNRAMAALALGRIGIATPEVRVALAGAWNSPDPWIRHNAALAVALLGPPMTNELPALLSGLKDKDNSALDSKLQAIGKLGPSARDALPALRELTQTNFLNSLVTNADTQIVGWAVSDLAGSAKIAICRINPDEGRPFLPGIADKIGRSWESVMFLREPSPLSNNIVRTVEPLLDETNNLRQSAAAYIILAHDKQHAGALTVLRQNRSSGKLNDRLFAGRLLFDSIGETNDLCALITEAFNSPESFLGQNAGQIAEKMGTNALPALPAIKAALWHKDRFVRDRAGILILKLAPQELPINEPK